MPKKKSEVSKRQECMFLGNNKELKNYLLSKKKALSQILKDGNFTWEKNRGPDTYINMIEEMLDVRFFKGSKVYTMQELVDAVRLERECIDEEIKTLTPEVESAKKLANEAFKKANGYLANKYEDSYSSDVQKELRQFIEDYEVVKNEFDYLERKKRVLWWLLGVIHRPVGFFQEVVRPKMSKE